MQEPTIIDTTDHESDWIFIANRSDLSGERALLPVILNNRAFILFADDEGELGLIGRHCPHRGADLCFGRLEDNGIRCPFHGWHFNREGQCVEQPAEPEGSNMHEYIKVPMVPLNEVEGKIFAFIGEDEPSS